MSSAITRINSFFPPARLLDGHTFCNQSVRRKKKKRKPEPTNATRNFADASQTENSGSLSKQTTAPLRAQLRTFLSPAGLLWNNKALPRRAPYGSFLFPAPNRRQSREARSTKCAARNKYALFKACLSTAVVVPRWF